MNNILNHQAGILRSPAEQSKPLLHTRTQVAGSNGALVGERKRWHMQMGRALHSLGRPSAYKERTRSHKSRVHHLWRTTYAMKSRRLTRSRLRSIVVPGRPARVSTAPRSGTREGTAPAASVVTALLGLSDFRFRSRRNLERRASRRKQTN